MGSRMYLWVSLETVDLSEASLLYVPFILLLKSASSPKCVVLMAWHKNKSSEYKSRVGSQVKSIMNIFSGKSFTVIHMAKGVDTRRAVFIQIQFLF